MGGFGLLLWKNAKLQLRRPKGTAFEIGLPAAFFAIMIVLREATAGNKQIRCERDAGGSLINATEGGCQWNVRRRLESSVPPPPRH